MREDEDQAAALRQSLARLQAILDATVDAIITIDDSGRIESANLATQRLFGWEPAELVGRNVGILMPAPFREEHDGYIARYLATGEARIIGIGREVVARRKDGSVFPAHLAVSEVQIEHRRIFTGIVRDLSERHAAEVRLGELESQAQQRVRLADIGAITAKVAHDLGNPLAAVAMQAQLFLRQANRNPSRPVSGFTNQMEKIVSELRRLDAMLKEFMTVARDQRLDLQRIDASLFIGGLVQLWSPLAAARQIRIVTEISEPGLTFWGDEVKLRRVLDNLLKNALEAIGDGGEVRLAVHAAGAEKISISISDDGPGFADGVTPFRMFETTKTDGTGLGLAISKEIVDAHGGDIAVEHVVPHGTRFRISLPRSSPHRGQR